MNTDLRLGLLILKNLLNQFKNGNSLQCIDKNRYRDVYAAIKYMVDNKKLTNYELSFLSKLNGFKHVSKFIDTSNINNEEVMCFNNREDLFNNFELLKEYPDKFIEYLNKNAIYKNRKEIEFDTNYIQIIPYMITKIPDKGFVVLEKIKGGDERVLNKFDFPAGHVNWSTNDSFYDSIYRELQEELGVSKDDVSDITFIDVLPVPKDIFSVSHYHLGVMMEVIIKPNVEIINKESEKHKVTLLEDIEDLDMILNGFDNWITYALNNYKY